MILSSLQMENYKKFQNYRLDFVEGLTGIIGRNGSGKSTIFDAITFALYGDVRGEKETIRYAKVGEKETVSVTLDFEIDSMEYRVVRELRGKALTAKAKLYKDGDELLSDGVKEVTHQITQLIGMNKEAFMHTVFASQKELTALSGLKSEERKKIIRKLLGLEKIDKIEQEIRSKLTDLNRDIKSYAEILLSEGEVKALEEEKKAKSKEAERLQKEVDEVVKSFESKRKEVEALEKALKALQGLKEAYVKLGTDLDVLNTNLENQKANLTRHKVKLQELQGKAILFEKEKPVIAEYKALQVSIDALQKQKELFIKKESLEKEQVLLRTQYEDDKKEILDLRKKLEAKPQLLQTQREQSELLQTSVSKLKELEVQESTLRQEIAKYNGLIENTNQQVAKIEALGKESNCPTCTRPLLDEYDNVIASLQSTIKQINTQEIVQREAALKTVIEAKNKEQENKTAIEKVLKELGEKLSVLSADEKTLAKKEEEFKGITQKGMENKKEIEALKEVKYDEKAHIDALTAKTNLEPKYTELLGLQTLIVQIPELQQELKDIEASIAKSEETIEKQKKAIKDHTYDAKEHEKQEGIYVEARKAKDAISEELSKKRVELAQIMGDIKSIQTKLDTNENQKKQLQTKLDDKNDYEKLKAFMQEFKNKINSQIAPRISQLASEMYATITRGKYQHIEVSNEFDFFIYDDGVRYPIERFSGGEVDLANLVLRIAISKTLSELSGSGGVGFLAFDEVFGSQDEERRFEIMEAFHTIKEQYRQIFLISHESEIKEMFERVVEL